MSNENTPVTIQATNKRFKRWLVIAWVVMIPSCAGSAVTFRDDKDAAAWWFSVFFVGFLIYMVTRIRIWWNHA